MSPTEKQLANLKPFKKGEVHNKRGYNAQSPVKRTVKRMVEADFLDMVSLLALGDIKKLEEMAAATSGPAIKIWLARCFDKARKRGDYAPLNAILDRLFGKPKEHIDLDVHKEVNYVTVWADENENRTVEVKAENAPSKTNI